MLHFTTYSCPVAVCKGPASMIPTTGDEGGKSLIFAIKVVSDDSTTTRVFSSDNYAFLFLYGTHIPERTIFIGGGFPIIRNYHLKSKARENCDVVSPLFVNNSVVLILSVPPMIRRPWAVFHVL